MQDDDKPEPSDFETVRRAFVIFNGFDGPGTDDFWWRTDDEYAAVSPRSAAFTASSQGTWAATASRGLPFTRTRD